MAVVSGQVASWLFVHEPERRAAKAKQVKKMHGAACQCLLTPSVATWQGACVDYRDVLTQGQVAQVFRRFQEHVCLTLFIWNGSVQVFSFFSVFLLGDEVCFVKEQSK